MAGLTSIDEFVACIRKSGLVEAGRLDAYLDRLRAVGLTITRPVKLAQILIRSGLLTKYQAEQLACGRWRNFLIGGKYKILERLGHGGMASVFLCEHQTMRRLVALKVLHAERARDAEILEHFRREGRAVARLQHPNIVAAFDVDQFQGQPYIVMEYVDGPSLEAVVQAQGPLDLARAAQCVAQAARGLQHIHESGMVHRDIKLGNLLVDRQGTVKILDLGLARVVAEEAPSVVQATGPRFVLGTIDYLAPEQARDSRSVDIRADIFSLGATFYYLLTGHERLRGQGAAEKLAWLQFRDHRPIEHLRLDLPVRLVEVIDRMLARDPSARYQTPAEVVTALAPWTSGPITPLPREELPRYTLAVRRANRTCPDDTDFSEELVLAAVS